MARTRPFPRGTAAPRARMGSTERGPTMSYCILVVDDEPTIHQFLHRVLTRQGYEVITAGNGEEADVATGFVDLAGDAGALVPVSLPGRGQIDEGNTGHAGIVR